MALATDRAVVVDRATATLATEQLGRTRYLTPEGFLLCQGVRLARVGPMLYAPDEMPDIEPGTNRMVVIERGPEVLFDPETILSFAGKAVTNDHPPTPVTPDNFRDYAVGVILNPRQGEGVEADYLIGDLLITDAQAIADVDAGKREVSCGYDVEVEQIKPGLGRVTKIVGNHNALVKRGRAGPSCSIQDEEPAMAKPRKRTIIDRLRTAFKANDEAAFEEELTQAEDELGAEGEDQPQRVVIELKTPEAPAASSDEGEGGGESDDPYAARFASLEKAVGDIATAISTLTSSNTAGDGEGEQETEAKDGEGEGEGEANDEAEEVEKKTAMDALAKAEILAPGIKLPTFDAAAKSVKSTAIVALQRLALKKAFATDGMRPHVEAVLGGKKPNFDTMAAPVLAVVFDGAAALARQSNNAAAFTGRRAEIPQGRMTPERYQQMLKDRRASRA